MYRITAPAEFRTAGPVMVRFNNTAAITFWEQSTNILNEFVIGSNVVADVLHLYPLGGAKVAELILPSATNELTLKANAAMAVDYDFTLPINGGAVGFALTTDGTGLTSWSPMGAAGLFFQNFITVAKNGNDGTGARMGPPFLTITAALAAALAGDGVYIYPGTYDEAITIPNNVSVVGMSTRAVIINRLLVVADTTLVTMGETCRLENVTLTLTSAEHHTLVGILFPGTTTATSKVNGVILTVDNSTALVGGSSDVYGVNSTGTGTPTEEVSAVRATTIIVNSIGLGNKRGILIGVANRMHIRDCNVVCRSSGGAGSYIGVQTNNAAAILTVRYSSIEGTSAGGTRADISQTLGTINLTAVNLLNSTANALGFGLAIYGAPFIFADPGGLPSNVTRFMGPGTTPVTITEIFVRIAQRSVCKSINVRATTGPGGARVDTFTVRKNGVNTVLVVTLTGAQTSNSTDGVSVTFNSGDDLSVSVVTAAGTATSNATVQVVFY